MKLSEYAKRIGIGYRTAYNWWQAGSIPGAWQKDTGTIIVPESAIPGSGENVGRTKTVVYARVNSNEQSKAVLEEQAERLVDFCITNGWTVDRVVKEISSGLNENRKQLESILADDSVRRIVVERRERLVRFGFHYIEMMGQAEGLEIVVANKTDDDDKDELMADFKSIVTTFCSRIYPKRIGKEKADAMNRVLSDVE